MFKGVVDSGILRNWIKAIKAVTNEFRLEIQKEGWLVVALNDARTALVDVSLRKGAFSKYEVGDDFLAAIDCDLLQHIVKDTREEIELEISQEKLIATSDKRRYEIRLLSPDTIQKVKVPSQFKHKAKIYIYTDDLQNGLKAAERVSGWDEVVFVVKDNKFFVKAVGESEVMEMTLTEDDLVKLEGEDCRSMFSINYLMPMIKAVNTQSLKLSLGTDEPIKIEWDDEDMSVMYLLAPRVSDDWDGA